MRRNRIGGMILAGAILLGAAPVAAQVTQADSLTALLSASRRSAVTRAELEASLTEIERILSADGYSGALKSIKRDEAALIRRRLAEGDLQPGDVINLTVVSEPALTGAYSVTPALTLVVPSIGTISVAKLLRSEVEAHLQKEFSRYLRDPILSALPLIRVSIMGGVNKIGYFLVPANAALADVLMASAGGPSGNADLGNSEVKRAGRQIVSDDAFTLALREGRTLDQLNMQAGDEIHVGQKTQSTIARTVRIVSGAASLTFLLTRIF